MSAGNSRRDEPTLPPGTPVGEYLIERPAAEGAMGTIYEGRHPLIEKKVAIKILHASKSKAPKLVIRFLNEARAANQIGHPNIVDIFSFGNLPNGRHFFIMEWLEGLPLNELIAQQKLPDEDILTILEQITSALSAAHAINVVHCDLKPANLIVLQRNGRPFVKLVDFGIAQLADAPLRRGPLIGTPNYMAPEQIKGEQLSPAADTYALGTIAYELFLRRMPYIAEDVKGLFLAKLSQPPVAPSKTRPGIPPALERLLQQLLARKPSDRPILSDVRWKLQELRSASLLTAALKPKQKKGHRPVLERRFQYVRDLAKPLLVELPAGMAWVQAPGPVPALGTPITVRFVVEPYGVHLEVGALVDHHLGTDVGRVLIRYDPIPESELTPLLSVATAGRKVSDDTLSPEDDPEASEAQKWFPAPTRKPSKVLSLPRAPLRTASLAPDSNFEPAGDTQLAPAPVVTSTEEAVRAHAVEPPPWYQRLGTKVTLLTLLITVLAVVGAITLALVRVRADRAFAFEELALRTAINLKDTLDTRIQLRLAELQPLIGGAESEVMKSGVVGLMLCNRQRCDTINGRLTGRIRGLWPDKFGEGRHVTTLPEGLLLSQRQGARGVMLLIDPESLFSKSAFPAFSTVQVSSKEGVDLFSLGARPLNLPDDVLGVQSGTRHISSADGTKMVLAWSEGRHHRIFVAFPERVAAQALSELVFESVAVMIGVLLLAAVVTLLFSKGLTARLRQLTAYASEIAEGRFVEAERLEGRDEVGQLAHAFSSMSRALSERDREILQMRRKTRQREATVSRSQMVNSLENHLLTELDRMQSLLSARPDSNEPVRVLRRREAHLRTIVQDVIEGAERAIVSAKLSRTRVDFASVVADAVDYSRRKMQRDDLRLGFEAPNAVFFPEIEARESELREIVITLLDVWSENAQPGQRAVVMVRRRRNHLLLSIKAPMAPNVQEVWGGTLVELEPMVSGHRAVSRFSTDEQNIILNLEFEAPVEDELQP